MISNTIIKVQKKLATDRVKYQVADLWMRGKSFKEIAEQLNTNPETVSLWLREYNTELSARMQDTLDNYSAERQSSIRNLIQEAWKLFNDEPTPIRLKMIRDLEMDLAKLQGVIVDKSVILSRRAKEEPEKTYVGFEDRLPEANIIEGTAREVT